MSPALSGRDVTRVGQTAEIVLRPHDHGSVDAWRRVVLDRVKVLVGADLGGFLIGASPHQWISDYPGVRVADYGTRAQQLVPGIDVWDRQAALGVHSRDEVWLPIRPDFYETAYYHDYLRPLRALDALGATWFWAGASSRRDVCQFLVHHDSDQGPRFGARERAILGLLRPALVAGTHNAVTAGSRVVDTVDRITAPVLVLDGTGSLLHRNPPAHALLEGMADLRDDLFASMRARVKDFAGGPITEPSGRIGSADRWVSYALSRMPLAGTRGSGYLATLRASRGGRITPPDDAARLLGLTRRQAEVALLLAAGLSNKAIALRLAIRPKTARRHTEAVLRGLGVTRRAAVASALLARGVTFGR